MSVVIIGGNECMERRYKDLCREYQCQAEVYIKTGTMNGKIGNPDLLVLFTGTMSHKMLRGALCCVKSKDTVIARSHASSVSALRNILETHAAVAAG